MPQGATESGIGSSVPSEPTADDTYEIKVYGETVAASKPETSSVKMDHRFLKWFTEIAITSEDQLYSYFLALDRTFFNGGKIDIAKQNAKENVQMTAFNLARDWNSFSGESNEQKLDKICDALEAIRKQTLEVEIRQHCSKIEK